LIPHTQNLIAKHFLQKKEQQQQADQ